MTTKPHGITVICEESTHTHSREFPAGEAISLIARVGPIHPGNLVWAEYAVNDSIVRRQDATWVLDDRTRGQSRFRATLPPGQAGDLVRYRFVVRRGGRQVISCTEPEDFHQLNVVSSQQEAELLNGESLSEPAGGDGGAHEPTEEVLSEATEPVETLSSAYPAISDFTVEASSQPYLERVEEPVRELAPEPAVGEPDEVSEIEVASPAEASSESAAEQDGGSPLSGDGAEELSEDNTGPDSMDAPSAATRLTDEEETGGPLEQETSDEAEFVRLPINGASVVSDEVVPGELAEDQSVHPLDTGDAVAQPTTAQPGSSTSPQDEELDNILDAFAGHATIPQVRDVTDVVKATTKNPCAPNNLQTQDLVLFALGSEGGPMLADNRSMEDGVHLRWGFRPELGYPLGGFEICRRPHLPGDPVCIGFPDVNGGVVASPWKLGGATITSPSGSLRINSASAVGLGNVTGLDLDRGSWLRMALPETARWVGVTVIASAPVKLTAYHGAMPVGTATNSGSTTQEQLVVQADAIDTVELSRAQGVAYQVCHVPATLDITQGWERLNKLGPVLLPVSAKDYPLSPYPNDPKDEAEAKGRVPSSAWKRHGGQPWEDLHAQLKELVRDQGPESMAGVLTSFSGKTMPYAPLNEKGPTIKVRPLQQTLAASVHHNMSRILGLYWIDTTAASGQVYDYLVTGHWDRNGRDTSPTATQVDFAGMEVGEKSTWGFVQKGLTILGPYFEVVERNSKWFTKDCALRLRSPKSGAEPTRIFFPEPVVEVQVYVESTTAGVTLTGFRNFIQQDQDIAKAGPTVLSVKKKGVTFDQIQLAGPKADLFRVCYLTKKNLPGDRSWIAFNVRRGKPASLAPPVGTQAVQVPNAQMPKADGALHEGQGAVAIRWDLPIGGGSLKAGQAIMYHVQRQYLGDQAKPLAIKNNGFDEVIKEPTIVSNPHVWTVVDQGTHSAPSDWRLDATKGNLQQTSKIYGGGSTPSEISKPGTMALAGRLEWSDYQLLVRLRTDKGDGAIGVVFRHRDRKNYYRFSMDIKGGYRRLVKRVNGTYTKLWEDSVPCVAGKTYEFMVEASGHRLRGWLDGALLFDKKDSAHSRGLIGLYCRANPEAAFDYVTVGPLDTEKPVWFKDSFSSLQVAPLPTGWPAYPLYMYDPGLKDGWYVYRTAGIDIFGRQSEYSAPALCRVLDRDPPPPPVIAEAKALQPRPANIPESMLDRLLTKDERDWLKTRPQGGIKVSWTWHGAMRRQAPDTSEFRVYFQSGQPNVIVGRITQVKSASSDTTMLTTDQTTTVAAGAFKGLWVRVGLNSFKITNSSTGTNFTLTVKNLENEEHVTVPSKPEWIKPVPAVFTLPLASTDPMYIDYSQAKRWKERLHVEPLGTIPTPAGKIANSKDNGNGTFTVTVDANSSLPDDTVGRGSKKKNTLSRFVPGVLVSAGRVYFADEHTVGSGFTITAKAAEVEKTAKATTKELERPAAGEPFIYYPGYRYSVMLQGLPLQPSLNTPVAYGQIGVTAVDNKAHKYAVDDPARNSTTLGNRAGNEGPVSSPHTIFAALRSQPKPLTDAPDPKVVFAEPADYHGLSQYTVRWEHGGDANLSYQVYRTTDESLMAVDKKNWATRALFQANDVNSYYIKDPSRWGPGATFPGIRALINALKTAPTAYNKLSDDAWQFLASLPDNEEAFTLITSQALVQTNPAHLDPADKTGKTMFYVDGLPGRSSNRYFYRVAVVDRAGNRSSLAPSSLPIRIPDTVPPQAPQPGITQGGDRKITLQWQANMEAGMQRYLIYRTDDEAKSTDIRLMGKPVHSVKQPQKASPTVEWEDKSVVGATNYYYRIVAVRKGVVGPTLKDESEVYSSPSEVIGARCYDLTPPDSPTITKAEWVLADYDGNVYPYGSSVPTGQQLRSAIHLKWTHKSDNNLTCLVQCASGTSTIYANASEWIKRGTYEYLHINGEVSLSHQYRLKVLNLAGNANDKYAVKAVPPAE